MKRIFFLLFAVVLLQSCQKDVSNKLNDNQDSQSLYEKTSILVINDRLSFKDTTSFTEHLQWIFENQANPELIKSFNNERNYESMFSIYEAGMNMENVSDFDNYLKTYPNSFHPIEVDGSVFYEMPSPAVIAYIANEDGIFQIGNKICRISYDYYYEITDGDESKIPLLFLPIENISDKSVLISETRDKSYRWGQYSYRTVYFSSKYRIVARLKKSLVAGMIYHGARTTSQKKSWTGVWVRRNIPVLGLSWNRAIVTFLNGKSTILNAYTETKYHEYNMDATIIDPYTETLEDESDIKRTVIMSAFEIDNSQTTCLARHWGIETRLIEITNNEIFP